MGGEEEGRSQEVERAVLPLRLEQFWVIAMGELVKRFSIAAFAILLLIAVVGCRTAHRATELNITLPADRLVFQRNLNGEGSIPVAGRSSTPGAIIEGKLTSHGEPKRSTAWERIGKSSSGGEFTGSIKALAGWYRLELRERGHSSNIRVVERVGIGEVFIVAGHSVAQGGKLNLPGAMEDRVNTIAWSNAAERREYERTGQGKFLPELVGTHFTNGIVPAPFGHGTYFWAQFAERVARKQNVPVLILNAAFGGTSLQHWARSSRGELFNHSFVRSEIRMPYVNLENALQRYATVLGVRAVLADQGQNDNRENDGNVIYSNYLAWVQQARSDLKFPELAIVVNRQTPPGNKKHIRGAQERMIREQPHCFAGPDYDLLESLDRYDGIHLSESGGFKVATMWADALDDNFFRTAKPLVPH